MTNSIEISETNYLCTTYPLCNFFNMTQEVVIFQCFKAVELSDGDEDVELDQKLDCQFQKADSVRVLNVRLCVRNGYVPTVHPTTVHLCDYGM